MRHFRALMLVLAAVAANGGTSRTPFQQSRTILASAQDGTKVSPDGVHIAFIDWNTSQVAIRDLASGTVRALTDKGLFALGVGFPEPDLVFSPTGDRVVFPFGNGEAADPFRYELRMTDLAGENQRVLATFDPAVAYVAPLDWNTNAGILWTRVAPDTSSDLLVMQPDGTGVRVLDRRVAGSGTIHQALFTPDSRAVVYLAGQRVYRLSLAGGSSVPLSFEANALLGWGARDGALIINSTRDNVIGNWIVPLRANGSPEEPKLIHETADGVVSAGRSSEGLYYVEPAEAPGLFVAEVDLAGGLLVSPPKRVINPSPLAAENPAWSRDGRRLAFTVHALNRTLHRVMGVEGLDAAPKEIARVDMRVMSLDWSADGQSLLIGGRTETRDTAWIGRIDVSTGVVDRIASAVPISVLSAGIRDEVAYVRAAPAGERTVRLTILPAKGESPRVVYTSVAERLPRSMSVSPDGQWIALIQTGEQRTTDLLLVPAAGGAPRTLLRIERPDMLEGNAGRIPWTTDGRKVLVMLRSQQRRQLATVTVASGELTTVPFSPQQSGRRQLALHPDGRTLVYADGVGRSELKLLSVK